ncbi:MAG: hypothetical protein KJO69_09170, partial [Gammaproteobacteria bacterium]|nr:hypothetical protein [Gammaproteobacteria bacterium]
MQNLSDNELLNAYIDGELTLSDRDQCLQRLNTELGFRRQYKALLEANEHYCRSVDEIDGRDYSEEIINLLQPEHEAHNSSGLWSRSNFLVAAVLLMVILPMSFFYLNTQRSTFDQQLHAVLTTQG